MRALHQLPSAYPAQRPPWARQARGETTDSMTDGANAASRCAHAYIEIWGGAARPSLCDAAAVALATRTRRDMMIK